MNKKFWKNKSVLITGFEGFLGSNLTRMMLFSGARIFGLDINVKPKKTILTLADRRKMTAIKGSVTNYKLLAQTLNKYKIHVVFHLAAEAIVKRSYAHPLRSFSTNVEGTWKVLEACRNAKDIQSVVVASSDKAYGSHKVLPYSEDSALKAENPYDVSKSCGDLIAVSYSRTYGVPAAITRCGNIFGPGDFNFSRIVPDAIRCALLGKKLLIRSNGRFTRDYVYVDDIVNGYILLAEQLKKKGLTGEAFNFSDENPMTVIELVHHIYRLIGKKPNYKICNCAKYEIMHQYLASGKARKILGWKPSVSLEEGLTKTMKWYKEIICHEP